MRRAGNRVVPVARDAGGAWRAQYRVSRRAGAAGQDGSDGTGLFLPLRIQHGFDAAGALRARRSFRDNRIAAALDRKRVGTGPTRMHLRRAAGAGGRGPCAAVPHGGATNLSPDGVFRHVHVPAGAQRLLCERLAPASVFARSEERAQSVHGGARPRTSVSAGPYLSWRITAICRTLDGVCDADGQWLPAISAELARTRSGVMVLRPSRRHDPRAGRAGRRSHAAGEPDRRARRQSLPLYSFADRSWT